MNLDDLPRMKEIDSADMLGFIDRLPDQLESAWQTAGNYPLDIAGDAIRHIVVAGMGGSGIGGALLAAYADHVGTVPVTVWRNYGLPAWARGRDTLVIVASHSGNTEEALSAFAEARRRGVPLIAITSGGELADDARAASIPLWQFTFRAQPRAAVGFLFVLPMACVARLGLMPDPSAELSAALTAMRDQQAHLRADIPAIHNPAKRMGGQWMGRWIAVYGSDHLAPVARRWKTQIAEIGKAWAQYEELPELDHNSVTGTLQPEDLTDRYMLVFLRSTFAHARNDLRARITRELLMVQGFGTDEFQASGPNRLAHMLTALHFGDYSAFYLAIAYGVDPSPVAPIAELKARLAAASR
jgi:glucose/mannose-6-phosphate isomerase